MSTCSRTPGPRPIWRSIFAVLEPGDVVLGLDLAHGGHLTHGMRLNFSGKLYHFVSYGVAPTTHRIDFDQPGRLAREHKPKLIVAGASAYPREMPHAGFAEIARECGARSWSTWRTSPGLVAAGLHDDPVPVADFVTTTTHKTLRGPRGGMILCKEADAKDIDSRGLSRHAGRPADAHHRRQGRRLGEALTPAFRQYARHIVANAKTLAEVLSAGGLRLVSGGTDNHLLLADVTPLGLTGGQAEKALGRCRITVNKNMIPFDTRKPMDPSGIRIGTPALTTRGMDCAAMRTIGGWILEVLRAPDDAALLARIAGAVEEMCRQFPVPASENRFTMLKTDRNCRVGGAQRAPPIRTRD